MCVVTTSHQELLDWRCLIEDCGAMADSYQRDVETVQEGATHADKVSAAHGLPFHPREVPVTAHLSLTCKRGHTTYLGERAIG